MLPIHSLSLSPPEIGAPFYRLAVEYGPQILDVMRSAARPGVTPPGLSVSIDDANRLFNSSANQELEPVLGVFGCFDDRGELIGFMALSELALDDIPYLEFYIFFKPLARQKGLAVDGANRLTRMARSYTSHPICTLIYSANAVGKKFYTKAGFGFDRTVSLEGMDLEMWLWNGELGDGP